MAANNAGHKLYGIWKKKYAEAQERNQERYGLPIKEYTGSKYRDSSMLKGVAEDIGEQRLLDIMDWYFKHKSYHDFSYFVFNYDKIEREMKRQQRDAERLERLREHTRRKVEELDIEL